MKTWNRERKRTRDRLLRYDFNMAPAAPQTAELPYVYPWENLRLNQLGRQIYELACQNGFEEGMNTAEPVSN